MDEMRAMLDELMGQDRDGDRVVVKKNITDKDVCKFYLLGFCPFTEFERTKHDFGSCQNVHDDACKADWVKLDDREKDRLGYERELKRWLDKLMGDLRSKIQRNEERLAQQEAVVFLPDDQARITQLSDEIQESITQAEVLGEQGDVDAAQAAAAKTERLKAQKAAFTEEAGKRASGGANRYGQQEVCPLSGVIINKEESRVRDHKNGRNYRAWCLSHDKLKELNETLKRRDAERTQSLPPPPGGPPRSRDQEPVRPSSERDPSRHRDGYGDRDRDSRDRDRTRDRDRVRDRDSRQRDGRRDRERDKIYEDRGRSRPEQAHRDRRRSRSRSRGRERVKDRGPKYHPTAQANGGRHR